MRRRSTLVLLALAILSAVDAWAQGTPSDTDLRALRFYVEEGDVAAQEAELRRLRRSFPEWEPPADLEAFFAPAPAVDTQRVYDLIGQGNFAAARAEIARLRRTAPGWSPPADMERLLALGEAQEAFDAAFARGDAAAAAGEARRVPDLLGCDRINNAWRLAEAQAAAGNDAAALAGYRAIVGTCTAVPDIVSTIEKADAVASRDELEQLVNVASRRFPRDSARFEALQRRLLAGRGVTAEPPARRAARRQAPGPAARAPGPTRIAPAMRRDGNAELRLEDLPARGDGRIGATREAARRSEWGTCLARSARPRSLDIAYQRAWCAYNMERPLEAIALFRAAMNGRLGRDVTRDARYGLSLALVARDMTEEAARVAAAGELTLEQRRTVELIILDQRAVRAYERGDFRQAIAFLDALEEAGGLRRDLGILRAYAFLELDDRVRAREEFRRLDAELSTPETRRGIELTFPTRGP